MSIKRYSIKMYIREGNKKRKGYPVYLRLIINRRKAEYYTNEHVLDKENWNPEIEQTDNNKSLNDRLNNIKKRVSDIIEEFEKKNIIYTAKQVICQMKGTGENNSTILYYFNTIIEEMKRTPTSHSTDKIIHYITTYNYLLRFLIQYAGKKIDDVTSLNDYNITGVDVEIRAFDLKMVRTFDEYLKNYESKVSKKKLVRNYVNKHHQRLNFILKKAKSEDKTTINPYNDFVLHYDKTQRVFLTSEEIIKLEQGNLGGNEGLIKVRDIFIFSVYTGLRFGEATTLTPKNVIISDNYNLINYQIEKKYVNSNNIPEIKKITHSIPMLRKAKEIYDKYKHLHETTGYILPRFSNQKVNSYLKIIAEMCGINKPLTHHSARHTMATSVLIENDVPIEMVSKWLGHEKIATTQIYSHISPKLLQKQAEKIDDILK